VPVTVHDEDEHNHPPLSYKQVLRLICTVTPGLVNITATLPDGAQAGTGIVLTSNGRVLTADHVVSHAIALSVRDLGNGFDYAARIVGTDPAHDIAVLQLDGATQLHTVHLGGRVAVGDVV
jgi:S1-C subfamily serine protease